MDLDYLYALQCAREASPEVLTTIIFNIAEIAGGALPSIIFAIIYWNVNKKLGERMFMSFASANALNGLMKITGCVYRPWIRDARLHVADIAAETATGYSFPSGHSTAAGAAYTSIAKGYKEKKPLVAVCIFLMLATPFGRNWVGAHTPQAVLVGLLVGIVLTFVSFALMDKLDKTDNGDVKLLAVVVIIVILGVAYTVLKPYPTDLGADGLLLADPYVMQTDTIKGMGMILGMAAGLLTEKRLVNFSNQVDFKTKVVRGVLGIILVLIMYLVIGGFATELLGPHVGGFIKRFLAYFAPSGLVPLCFKVLKIDR